jgi:hypothetical protein
MPGRRRCVRLARLEEALGLFDDQPGVGQADVAVRRNRAAAPASPSGMRMRT